MWSNKRPFVIIKIKKNNERIINTKTIEKCLEEKRQN